MASTVRPHGLQRYQTGVCHILPTIVACLSTLPSARLTNRRAAEEQLQTLPRQITSAARLPIPCRRYDEDPEPAITSDNFYTSGQPEVLDMGTRNDHAILGSLAVQQALSLLHCGYRSST